MGSSPAALRLQRPQPGEGQDEAGGRASREIHCLAGAGSGAAVLSGVQGQGRLSMGPGGGRAGDVGLS